MQQFGAAWQLLEMVLEPDQHPVLGAGRRPRDSIRRERVPDLVDRRWHGEPEEQPDRDPDHDEVEEDRDRLGDTAPPEPFDARPDRGRERECEEQEDEDAPHLPEAERECHHGERGGGRLRNAQGEVATGRRVRFWNGHLRTTHSRPASWRSAG